MQVLLILNGPNLNMLGTRQPEIYGTQTLDDIEEMCRAASVAHGFDVDFRQSNHEGELVTWLQESQGKVAGIVINAAAYSHTSIAILDALSLHSCPIVEVHLTDISKREAFRHTSFVSLKADHFISGKGAIGYIEAIDFIAHRLND
jgi:3-dehydroquinate dehydratase II